MLIICTGSPTEYNCLVSIRLIEWITGSVGWKHFDGTMNRGTRPVTMGMPPDCSFLCRQIDLLCEISSRLNWALCNVLWTIWPWIPWLSNSMPANFKIFSIRYFFFQFKHRQFSWKLIFKILLERKYQYTNEQWYHMARYSGQWQKRYHLSEHESLALENGCLQ